MQFANLEFAWQKTGDNCENLGRHASAYLTEISKHSTSRIKTESFNGL
jgi:hypothetical protein